MARLLTRKDGRCADPHCRKKIPLQLRANNKYRRYCPDCEHKHKGLGAGLSNLNTDYATCSVCDETFVVRRGSNATVCPECRKELQSEGRKKAHAEPKVGIFNCTYCREPFYKDADYKYNFCPDCKAIILMKKPPLDFVGIPKKCACGNWFHVKHGSRRTMCDVCRSNRMKAELVPKGVL